MTSGQCLPGFILCAERVPRFLLSWSGNSCGFRQAEAGLVGPVFIPLSLFSGNRLLSNLLTGIGFCNMKGENHSAAIRLVTD